MDCSIYGGRCLVYINFFIATCNSSKWMLFALSETGTYAHRAPCQRWLYGTMLNWSNEPCGILKKLAIYNLYVFAQTLMLHNKVKWGFCPMNHVAMGQWENILSGKGICSFEYVHLKNVMLHSTNVLPWQRELTLSQALLILKQWQPRFYLKAWCYSLEVLRQRSPAFVRQG